MITGMLICTLFCFLERLERPELAFLILPGLADTVPWFRGCRKNVAGSGNFFLELIPRPTGLIVVVVHIRCRAYLVDNIIVSQDVVCSDAQLPHQMPYQPYTGLLRLFRKIPFRVRCQCSIAVTLAAHLDADRVVVVGLRVLLGVITGCSYRPRHCIQTATLVDGAIPVDVEMCTTSICRQIMCLTDHAQIMHSNVLFLISPCRDSG